MCGNEQSINSKEPIIHLGVALALPLKDAPGPDAIISLRTFYWMQRYVVH